MFKIVHETTVKHQTTTAFQWHNGSFVIRSAKQGVKSGPVELRSIGTFSCHMATLPVKGLMFTDQEQLTQLKITSQYRTIAVDGPNRRRRGEFESFDWKSRMERWVPALKTPLR